MTVQTDLLIEIEAFLAKRQGMAETTFGKAAVNDGKFVRRLRDGCNMTLATIDRVRQFMKSQPQTVADHDAPEARAKRSGSPTSASKSKQKRSTPSQGNSQTSSAEAA